jgi:hypothetical protein
MEDIGPYFDPPVMMILVMTMFMIMGMWMVMVMVVLMGMSVSVLMVGRINNFISRSFSASATFTHGKSFR